MPIMKSDRPLALARRGSRVSCMPWAMSSSAVDISSEVTVARALMDLGTPGRSGKGQAYGLFTAGQAGA